MSARFGLPPMEPTGAVLSAARFLAVAVWLCAVPAAAQHGEQEPASALGEERAPSLEDLPESIVELFEETNDDGEPVVGPDLQQYFVQLPTHAHELFAEALEEGMIMGAEHTRALLSLRLDADKMELVLRDNCILCHTASDMQFEETLMRVDTDPDAEPAHMSLVEFLSDVHFRRGLSCAGCHGGSPDDTEMVDEIYERWPGPDERDEDRTWIPGFCGDCHADPSFMQRYDPSLPTDQLAKYRTSRHGELLLEEGDSKAAQCVSCHGVHGIRTADSRRSMVHPQAIPGTCGQCHSDEKYMEGYVQEDGTPLPTDQVSQYEQSVHGRALLERGDLGAPACNDCHGNHAARPPQVAYVSQVCRTCHAANGQLFDGSNHKQAFAANNWPECETCHGKHDIEEATDAMLGTEPGDLCYDCHVEYAPENEQCIKTADHFRVTISELEEQYHAFEERTEWLAERGLDAQALGQTTSDLHDVVRQARSAIHAFDRSDFGEVSARGWEAIETGRATIDEQMEEYSFRRQGLAMAILALSFLAVMLWLKTRQIERRRGGSTIER